MRLRHVGGRGEGGTEESWEEGKDNATGRGREDTMCLRERGKTEAGVHWFTYHCSWSCPFSSTRAGISIFPER